MLKQMGRFSTKYGRYVFFALLVIVCISFVLTADMISCDDQRNRARVAGTLFGEDVPIHEYEGVKDRWRAFRMFMMYSPKTVEVIASTMDMKGIPAQYRQWVLRGFFQGTPDEKQMNDFAWRLIAFLRDARKQGVVVTDAEVGETVQDMFGGAKFNQAEYISLIEKESRRGVEEFEETIREALILSRYYGLVQDGAAITTEDVYNRYLKSSETCRVRTLKFSASDYEDRVRLVPTRDAVRPADESKRPVVISGDMVFAHWLREKGTLTIEPKVRFEYVFTEYEKFREGITPLTDPQIEERYEGEKEAKYRIKTTDGVYKPLDEVKAEVKRQLLDAITDERVRQQYEADKEAKYKKADGTYTPLDEVKGQIRKDLEAAVNDEAVKAEYEKSRAKYLIRDEDKRYKPLEEVKEEIRKALELDQMKEKAIEKIGALREEIDALQLQMEDENGKIDLAGLATKHGVTYGKTPLFDEHHMTTVEQTLGKVDQDELQKLMTRIDQFPVGTIFGRMDTDKGTFIARIDEKADSFVPPLTVPVRQKLARQLVEETARRLAFRDAQGLFREARKRIDQAVEEWGKANPTAPQEEREKALQGVRRDVFERLLAEKGLSPTEGAPIRREDYQRAEATMFDLPRYEIEFLPKGRATAEGDPSTYEKEYSVAQLIDRYQPDGKDFDVIKPSLKDQLTSERQREYLDAWLATVWETAKLDDRLHKKPATDGIPPPDDNP